MKNPIDLVAQAAAFADRYNMLPQAAPSWWPCLAGGDSMALLSVLEKLAQERDLHLHAAHFNHQLGGRSPSGTRPSSPSGARSGTSP